MRAALQAAGQGEVREVHSTYHIPISNTGGAVMLFETSGRAQALAAE
jgi:hypothetical protein